MRFQVPQFIDVEDKIFGPLTFKQFIYLAGGVALAVIVFYLLPTFIAIFIGVPIIVLGVALAFYKVNDRPFIQVVEDFFHYSTSSKLYVWKREEKKSTPAEPEANKPAPQIYVPKLSESKLKDLSWSLDIKESSDKDDLNQNQLENKV